MAFAAHIGSLSLCFWMILGHIGRGDLECRVEDISLSAWVRRLRERSRNGRKCIFIFFSLFGNIPTNQNDSARNAAEKMNAQWCVTVTSALSNTLNPHSSNSFATVYYGSDSVDVVSIKSFRIMWVYGKQYAVETDSQWENPEQSQY